MRKILNRKFYVLLFVAACVCILTACTTAEELSEEMRASMVMGQVFEPEKQVEYVPYEVVKYVYPEEGRIVEQKKESATSGDILSDNVAQHTVTVGEDSDFYNSIVEYSFLDGKIYDIFASPRHVTDIRLSPGETISGEAAIGDSESWQMSTAVSNEKGRTVTHIYVRPVTTGLETSMIIPTDHRTYYLRLMSYDDLYMVGVRWKYPGISTFGSSGGGTLGMTTDTVLSVDVTNLNWGYEVKGDNTVWKPVAVYDDGVHTYFQFDPRFEVSAGAPSLYLLPKKSNGASKAEIVNYIIRGNMYIADFILQANQAWYLMADKTEVKITRK